MAHMIKYHGETVHLLKNGLVVYFDSHVYHYGCLQLFNLSYHVYYFLYNIYSNNSCQIYNNL